MEDSLVTCFPFIIRVLISWLLNHSNSKCSTLSFESSAVSIKLKYHLKMELCLYSGIWETWGNYPTGVTIKIIDLVGKEKGTINTLNCRRGNLRSNPKALTPHFTSNKALLKCKGHSRVEWYLLSGILGIREIWENYVPVSQFLYNFAHFHLDLWDFKFTLQWAQWSIEFKRQAVLVIAEKLLTNQFWKSRNKRFYPHLLYIYILQGLQWVETCRKFRWAVVAYADKVVSFSLNIFAGVDKISDNLILLNHF